MFFYSEMFASKQIGFILLYIKKYRSCEIKLFADMKRYEEMASKFIYFIIHIYDLKNNNFYVIDILLFDTNLFLAITSSFTDAATTGHVVSKMRFAINNLVLLIFINLSCCYINLRNNPIISKSNDPTGRYEISLNDNNLNEEIAVRNRYLEGNEDAKKIKIMKLKKELALRAGRVGDDEDSEDDSSGFQMDPVLNMVARRSKKNYKREDTRRRSGDEDYKTSSSSVEAANWKEQWRNVWLKKKMEALNSSFPTGDSVNMLAARPWGVSCGDPNQHDMPWGSCTLPMECEAEYRIYRGDLQCGRTQFVCCALQLSTYDMYEGFDLSLADSSLQTDTEERKERQMSSREQRMKKKKREKKKRKRDRDKRKRKIKKNIKNIIKEMKKILAKVYRNGTTLRKRKTKQLKRFIKELKRQYKRDRQSVKDLHEMEMIKVDATLMKKLNQIRLLNRNFARNSTFRDIIINGTMTKRQARMLTEAYPELQAYIITRRSGNPHYVNELDYDIEYGYLYY